MEIWVLTITTFEDDYKHRYDSGVYQEEPILFKNYDDAYEHLKERFLDELMDRYDTLLDKNLNDLKKKLKYNQKKHELKYRTSDQKVEDLMYLLEGSYVERTFDFEIVKKIVK